MGMKVEALMGIGLNMGSNQCEKFVVWSLTSLCFMGCIYLSEYLIVSATALLEVIFIMASLCIFINYGVDKKALIISNLSLAYLFYSLVTVLLVTKANLLDFIQAFKSYYYLMLLGFFYNKSIFSSETIKKLFGILLILFLSKYTMDKFLLGNPRPTLLIENNFELILLVLLYYFVNIIKREPDFKNTFIMILICLISGSRSSLFALMIAIIFSLNRKIDYKKIIFFLVVPVVMMVVYITFQSRLEQSGNNSYQDIDRYRFFLEFLYSTSQWPWWEFITGSKALTPLSPSTCANLSYYHTLFSYSGDESCYSVILHSFVLRVIYDHGFIGLVMLISAIFLYLNKFRKKDKLCIILILMATALSVSSLNNVYVSLALVFFIASSKDFTEVGNDVSK